MIVSYIITRASGYFIIDTDGDSVTAGLTSQSSSSFFGARCPKYTPAMNTKQDGSEFKNSSVHSRRGFTYRLRYTRHFNIQQDKYGRSTSIKARRWKKIQSRLRARRCHNRFASGKTGIGRILISNWKRRGWITFVRTYVQYYRDLPILPRRITILFCNSIANIRQQVAWINPMENESRAEWPPNWDKNIQRGT